MVPVQYAVESRRGFLLSKAARREASYSFCYGQERTRRRIWIRKNGRKEKKCMPAGCAISPTLEMRSSTGSRKAAGERRAPTMPVRNSGGGYSRPVRWKPWVSTRGNGLRKQNTGKCGKKGSNCWRSGIRITRNGWGTYRMPHTACLSGGGCLRKTALLWQSSEPGNARNTVDMWPGNWGLYWGGMVWQWTAAWQKA